MKELGQFLKEKREEKGVSLEEVSVATKIGVRVLQSIEDGDLSKLPPKAFVRGFIQSYAKYLNLDVKEILDKFQEAVGSTNPKSIPIPEVNRIERDLPGGIRKIVTVVAIVFTIVAIIIIQRVISKREAEMRSGEIQAITGDDTPLLLKTSQTPSLTPLPSPSLATPAPSVSPIPTPVVVGRATPQVLAKFVPVPSATPIPVSTPSPTATPSPIPAPTEAPTPVPTPEVLIPQEIIIEALDKVTLKITIDSKPPQEVQMNADQIQTFRAKGKIKIFTPDGGAISIIQNGYDLGVPGNLGQPKTMVYPK